MRFFLMGLSVAAVLAADFAVKNISIGQDGTVWFETIETSPESQSPFRAKAPNPTPDVAPVTPSRELPAPDQESLPRSRDLWNMDEYA